MINIKKNFLKKKMKQEIKKICYLVNDQDKYNLYSFHYFSKQKTTRLVCIQRGLISKNHAKLYAKTYNYKLKTNEMPEYWETTK